MLKSLSPRACLYHARHVTLRIPSRKLSKAAGDISSVFPSLSGAESAELPPRFADLKSQLISGHEERLRESWEELLSSLMMDTQVIKALGPTIVPELDFKDLGNVEKRTQFRDEFHKRGVAVIRGVVSEKEALGWKELLRRYIQNNPSTKGGSLNIR